MKKNHQFFSRGELCFFNNSEILSEESSYEKHVIE